MLAPLRGSGPCLSHRLSCCLFLFALFPGLAASRQPQPKSDPSVAELKSLAESGDVTAQHQLAQFLLETDPAAPGYALAIDWVRAAAAHNNSRAQFLLGFLFEHGTGLPLDYSKAAEFYQAAALQGHRAAQNNLAALYQRGLGVPMDLAKAFDLFLAAARQSDSVAECNLAGMYSTGSGTPRDLTEAAHWFRVSAAHGNSVAQYNLGKMYFRGQGVPVDYRQAGQWVLLAAQQGHPQAELDLAFLYETGRGMPLDYVAAYAWYSRALAAGVNSSASRLNALTHVMTSRQLEEARSLLAALSSTLQLTSYSTNSDVSSTSTVASAFAIP